MDSQRPDPEVMLAKAKREEREQSGRGTLRVYLGAFPGVGKTYAMLNEAQRRRKYGEDVVVGFVETHHRAQTEAILQGLEIIPRKRVEYRGVTVEEMDVEAILRRRPAVCLVDELAHTNAPSSEREKRYEDVQVLLDAGINVVSTLNVQHVESLNDTVENITGVRVRETVPDSVVDEADELILIDLSPEGARARMEHGHIYPPAQAQAALESFFRPQNLAALRELALRRTAQEVEEQLDEYMREIATDHAEVTDRVLVLVDATPFARTLIRRGWRLAQGMHADLLVAYVAAQEGSMPPELARSLELAEDLNATIRAIAGPDEATLIATLKAEGANHVVLVYQPSSGMRRLTSTPLHERIMRALPNVDVHLVSDA